MGLSLLISVLLFPSILTPPQTYNLGDVADRDIKANREFLVENSDLTEKNRLEAVRKVLPVYDFDPTGNDVVARIREAFAAGRKYSAESLANAWNAGVEEKDTASRLEKPTSLNRSFLRFWIFRMMEI